MKKTMFAALVAGAFFSFTEAAEFTYSQNNTPSLNRVKGKYNFLVNADILLGKVEIPRFNNQHPTVALGFAFPNVYAFETATGATTPSLTKVLNAYQIKNAHKMGFSGGLGVGLNRNVNLSLQYKHLRSGKKDHKHTTTASASINVVIGSPADGVHFDQDDRSIALTSKFHNRLELIDLLVQTSRWMTGNILFQPFAALRYGYERARFELAAVDATDSTLTYTSNRRYNRSAIGVLFGTDVKYVLNKYFHFFSAFWGQMTANMSEKVNVQIASNLNTEGGTAQTTQNGNITYRFDEPYARIVNSWGYKFGVAFDYSFGSDWLLTTRVFLEQQEGTYTTWGAGFTLGF
jgi:hypothetical protein